MFTSYFNWSEKSPYGLLALVLLVQGNIVIPAVTLLILYSGLDTLLISGTVLISMTMLVMILSLQPPRIIAKIFLFNLFYHVLLGVGLGIGLLMG